MIAVASDFRSAYLSLEAFGKQSAQWRGSMLGTVCFTPLTHDALPDALDAPFAPVSMPALDIDGTAETSCEAWFTAGPVVYGRRDSLYFGHDADLLFGSIQLDEAAFASPEAAADGKTPLQRAAESAYTAIFALMDELRFPHVLRFWNYISDINAECHGLERYRQFNMGRQDGFIRRGRQTAGSVVPAASAVGCDAGPLTVYFLAGRGAKPIAIENPRQVSAYHYPAQYGPRAPTFSRASVARIGDADVLLISGTASIVGHQSVHVGDVLGQVRETVENLKAIVHQANLAAPQAQFVLEDLCFKAYVRNASDVTVIDGELRQRLGASARILYLRADICRQDLLVEIEATGGHPLDLL